MATYEELLRKCVIPPARPDWETYWLGVAEAISKRGDCSRRQVGAVVVDRFNRQAGAGYNGTYPGGPSCLKGECPRAFTSVEPGSSYDTGPGACVASHAEINCVMDVDDRSRLAGATIYVTCEPCGGCRKILLNSTKITMAVWPEGELIFER